MDDAEVDRAGVARLPGCVGIDGAGEIDGLARQRGCSEAVHAGAVAGKDKGRGAALGAGGAGIQHGGQRTRVAAARGNACDGACRREAGAGASEARIEKFRVAIGNSRVADSQRQRVADAVADMVVAEGQGFGRVARHRSTGKRDEAAACVVRGEAGERTRNRGAGVCVSGGTCLDCQGSAADGGAGDGGTGEIEAVACTKVGQGARGGMVKLQGGASTAVEDDALGRGRGIDFQGSASIDLLDASAGDRGGQFQRAALAFYGAGIGDGAADRGDAAAGLLDQPGIGDRDGAL